TTNFTPGSLNYSIPSEPSTVHDLLIQKSNGNFELAVWDENTTANDSVTVNLGSTYGTVNVYDPTVGTTPTQTLSSVSSLPLTLHDHPVILDFAASAPLLFEAESLPVAAQTSGITYRTSSDSRFSGGAGSFFDATAANQFVTFDVPGIVARTYS